MEEETLQNNNKLPISIRFVMALLSSFIVVIGIYFISSWLDAMEPQMQLPGFTYKPFSLVPSLVATLIGISLGVFVFVILKMNTTAWRVSFNIIVILVLILAFVATLMVPDASNSMIITLNLMHIGVAVCTVYFFSYFNKLFK
ncbi:MAG: DUF6069 family protein [Bacteroidota bacterium]|nr:DUF6069 family protein [Bacteroidota bacterium]